MSKKREMIILEPEGRVRKEGFCSRPMTCPYCNGRGGFIHDIPGGTHEIECPDCEGTGEVVALVTIDWKPNKK